MKGSFHASTADYLNITLTGARLDGKGSSIKASTEVDPGEEGETSLPRIGNAGPIFINTSMLTLKPGTEIVSNTSLPGQGGRITIQVNSLRVNSAIIQTTSIGKGSGNAGNISATAVKDLWLTQGSSISTFAEQADGGNVKISVGNTIYLSNSEITATVAGGVGNGGNITIDPIFVILKSSDITANAFGGDGGNIQIVTDHFFASPDSILRASSKLGVEGTVEIDSPDTNIIEGSLPLPATFFDASIYLSEHCSARTGPHQSSFTHTVRVGIPFEPDIYLPALLLDFQMLNSQGLSQSDLKTAGFSDKANSESNHHCISENTQY